LAIEWRDISCNIVNINHLVKDHKTGGNPVSNKLLAMLNILPHDSERVFSYRYDQVANAFKLFKRRIAAGTKNERFNYIELRTFRHWGGTKLVEMSNGNVLTVMKFLRHKSVTSTMKYIDIYKLSFRTETEYEFLAVTTPEELKVALLGCYTLVIEKFGSSWFRRPKRIAIAGTPIVQREPQCPSATNEDSYNKENPAIRNAY
jgi:hypothetical protein